MCGIAAIIPYRPASKPIDRDELQRMTGAMASRGPDGEGVWYDAGERAALGHRRLSIIDLSEHGAQPMAVHGGRYTITYNGEIYNYRELRSGLEKEGVAFHSHTDTEVIMHLYHRSGPEMLGELRGMFAFVIWDSETGTAFVARDAYGMKPLYYSDDDSVVRIASQVKALLAGGRISQQVDPAGKAGFYMMGSVPEPFTFYSAIKAVPAGTWMKISSDGMSGPYQWYSIADIYCRAREKAVSEKQDYFDLVRDSLRKSVEYHMVADVQVGAFLSAGIDSTSLVGIMRDIGIEDIRTLTLAFEEYKGKGRDESPLAGEVARLYGTEHTERSLSAAEFRSDLPKFLAAMDQPTIDGLNSYFVSKAASELGLKVVLSGLGGDELFAGYNTFVDVPDWVGKFRIPASIPLLGKAFRSIYNAVFPAVNTRSPKVASVLEYGGSYAGAYYLRRGVFMPWELDTVMETDEIHVGVERLGLLDRLHASLEPDPGTPFGRVATLESTWYMRNQLLRDTDWAGMAHSLEIRVPFVDAFLLKQLAPHTAKFGTQYGKQPIMDSPDTRLPEGVRKKSKTGFFVPIQEWLKAEESIAAWKSNTALAGDGTSWARRWAYSVVSMTEQGER